MDDAKFIALAKQAGFADDKGTVHAAYQLKAFATLVMANVDPKSYTSWQEGYETGKMSRPWVGLEAEEVLDLFDRNNVYGSKWIEFARTVEAKLKAKNDH
jgi:hypothetical protein